MSHLRLSWIFMALTACATALLLACSAQSDGTGPANAQSGPGSGDDPTSEVETGAADTNNTSAPATTSSSSAGTTEFELPATTAITSESSSTSGVEGKDSCTVAILGDPGWNPAADFGAWIAERGPVVDRFGSDGALASLSASELSHYDVALLDLLGPDFEVGVTPEELAAWVRGGGSLIALSGYGDTDDALSKQNELLAPLSLGFDTSQVLWGPVTTFLPHPITQGLTNITFIGGRKVMSLPDDEVIMTIQDPPIQDPPIPVGVAVQRDAGRAFLFGDEWITYDSEWSSIPEIQVMWVNIFNWLADCELEVIIR